MLGRRQVGVIRPGVRSLDGRESPPAELAGGEPGAIHLRTGPEAEGFGCIDAALRALVGAAAGGDHSAGHQQERSEQAVRVRHRAQAGRTDERHVGRSSAGGADDRRLAFRRARGAWGSGG